MTSIRAAYRPTEAVVDLDAIAANLSAVTPAGVPALAVVKADAYGHGAVAVARTLLDAGAVRLGVALVEEGITLREAGIDAPILVLSEAPAGSEHDAIALGLTPTICTPEGVDAIAGAADATGRPRPDVAVHVKVDTGMHRNGVWPPGQLAPLAARVAGAGLTLEGVWTHLARADDDEDTTARQLRRLQEALASLPARPPVVHAANSAATIRFPASHLDLVRPGIALYGIEPAPGIGADLGLRPAMTWRSRVSAVRRLDAGEAVSYGHRYRLERPSTIATVPVGYADGYPRALSSRAEALLNGRRRPVAGAVTMDQLLLDCGDDPVRVGDEVVLLGRQGTERVTAAELAELAGTIGYEIVTGVGARVPRRHVGGVS